MQFAAVRQTCRSGDFVDRCFDRLRRRRWSTPSSTGSVGCLGEPLDLSTGRGSSQDGRIRLGLRLQRGEQAGSLRERCVEQASRTGDAGLHAASELREEDLTGLEVGKLLDLVGLQDLAVQEAALDDESLVLLREVTQALCCLDDIAGDEGDGGRAGEELVRELDVGLLGSELGQRVLGDGVSRVLTE